jgi:hypothetical protein
MQLDTDVMKGPETAAAVDHLSETPRNVVDRVQDMLAAK